MAAQQLLDQPSSETPPEPQSERRVNGRSVPRKKLVRRQGRDYSQQLRLGFQLAFLLLNVWIGVQFYQWVRWAESGGQATAVSRPAGVEGWLPIQGLMQLRYFVGSGRVPAIHAASFFLFVAFLLMSWLLRKSFCSWLCPVGTAVGISVEAGTLHLPPQLSAAALARSTPALAKVHPAGILRIRRGFDVGRCHRGVHRQSLRAGGGCQDAQLLPLPGSTAAYVVARAVRASLLVQNFWCRYLCPYGALLGLAGLASPTRIVRTESACIDCAKCAKACPASLPVDKLVQIRSAECTGCLECVAVCPAKDALDVRIGAPVVGGSKRIPAWTVAAGVAVIFAGLVGYAKLSGHWDTHLPSQVYFQLVPAANQQQHP